MSTPLPKYEELTDFQKWFLFYAAKHGPVPRNLNGVISNLCMTIKMNMNVDDYENEIENFKKQAQQLAGSNLLVIGMNHVTNDSYYLTDKGTLYIIQKILKPLYDAKQKKDLTVIRDYFKTDSEKILLNELFMGIIVQDPQKTLSNVGDAVLKLAMPTIKILDAIQKFLPHPT